MLDDQALEGLVIHVLEPTQMLRTRSGFASSTLLARGDVLELTADDVEMSRNRNGESYLSCIDDDDLQRLRWGRVVYGIGPWPTGLPVYRAAYGNPATWNNSKTTIESTTVASYAGDGGQPFGVRVPLRDI